MSRETRFKPDPTPSKHRRSTTYSSARQLLLLMPHTSNSTRRKTLIGFKTIKQPTDLTPLTVSCPPAKDVHVAYNKKTLRSRQGEVLLGPRWEHNVQRRPNYVLLGVDSYENFWMDHGCINELKCPKKKYIYIYTHVTKHY